MKNVIGILLGLLIGVIGTYIYMREEGAALTTKKEILQNTLDSIETKANQEALELEELNVDLGERKIGSSS